MKLRPRPKKENRDPNQCSASRCNAEPSIIDATCKLDDCDVHLCQKHWKQRCDEDDAEIEARAMMAKANRLKPGQNIEPGRYNLVHTDEGLEVVP